MARIIKYEDLTCLLEQIFGENWENTYNLDHDMLGYVLFVKQENGCVDTFSRESRRHSPKKMYAYLLGLWDMKRFLEKQKINL
ncbi:MAG: hypothetical protein LBS69_03065 [Prevotellaceae bacterium]|jgi:hypothetical protein|nr:hypothetical protein [Prevotellaceae bacterium]